MGPLERKRGNVTRRQAVIRPMCSPNVVADYHAVTDGIEERHSWRGNQFSTCMVLFEGYQFVESLKFIDLTRRIWFPMHARDTCKLYCILFARSKLDSIRRTGESYDPFLVHDLVFPFLPLFFSPEKRERERKIYQDSPLVSARRASLSARRYEEDVYDARRNFSLKLPTRYSSICAYQEVDNGVLFREGGALCRRPIFYPARSIVVYRSSVIIKWDSTYERSWKIVLNRHAYIYINIYIY